jgi:branched-chain amino acid transport system substrate-binding protein
MCRSQPIAAAFVTLALLTAGCGSAGHRSATSVAAKADAAAGSSAPGTTDGPSAATPQRTTGSAAATVAPQGSTTAPGASSANPRPAAAPPSAPGPGVTASTIQLGNIVSKSGSFGPDQFTPFYYGAAAYFADVNAHGGIHGRKVVFNTCDDQGDDAHDRSCAQSLVDDKQVFAFVANDCLSCGGLTYISDKTVPSVGGLATDFRDYALPHFWRYSGNPYPQNGHVGYKGKLYDGTQQYRYFKQKYGVKKAGVVYYDTAASKVAVQAVLDGLAAEGISATGYAVNPVVPVFDKVAADMAARGITAVWDAVGLNDNRSLCSSVEAHHVALTAKVSLTVQWTEAEVQQLSAPCRSSVFQVNTPGAASFDDNSNPQVASFRAGMSRYFPARMSHLSQPYLDGWASAMEFDDAARSCRAALTRSCLEAYLNRPGGYAARGLWSPRGNTKIDFSRTKTAKGCVEADQWDDAAKRFVVRASFRTTCYATGFVTWPAPR